MNELTPLFLGFVGPGLWSVTEVGKSDQEFAQTLGLAWLEVDLSDVDSKETLMTALKRDLGLPDYFGRNWDALDECLGDLEGPLLIVVKNAATIMGSDPGSATQLAEILNDATSAWRPASHGFASAVWVGAAPEGVPALRSVMT